MTAPQLDIGALLMRAAGVFGDHFGRLVLVGALPLWADALFIQTALGDIAEDQISVLLIAAILAEILALSLSTAMLVQITLTAEQGRTPDIRAALKAAARCLAPMTGVLVLTLLVLTAGFAALILPGLWAAAALSVAAPAVINEGGGLSSLSRSAELTKGRRWRIVVVLVLAGVLIGVLGYGGAAFADLFGTGGLASYLGLVASGFTEACGTAYLIVVLTLLYRRLIEVAPAEA